MGGEGDAAVTALLAHFDIHTVWMTTPLEALRCVALVHLREV
jgi:hypothetical protein